nr:hypothetical protein [Microbulbifer taiwanensis]
MNLFRVLPTVQFDNQFRLQAYEVDYVSAYGLLAFELQAHQSLGAEKVPKALLSFGGVGAQFPRPFQLQLSPSPDPSPASGGGELSFLIHWLS